MRRNIAGAFLLCIALFMAVPAVRAETVEIQKLLQAEEPSLWQMDAEDIFTLFPQKSLCRPDQF